LDAPHPAQEIHHHHCADGSTMSLYLRHCFHTQAFNITHPLPETPFNLFLQSVIVRITTSARFQQCRYYITLEEVNDGQAVVGADEDDVFLSGMRMDLLISPPDGHSTSGRWHRRE
jgi:hypothetical protein